MNPIRSYPFAQKIDSATFFGDQQEIGYGIGDDAVDLFRHRAVKTAQSGLSVNYLDTQFRRHQGSSHCGVNIADHEECSRIHFEQDRLNSFHDLCCLQSIAAVADSE